MSAPPPKESDPQREGHGKWCGCPACTSEFVRWDDGGNGYTLFVMDALRLVLDLKARVERLEKVTTHLRWKENELNALKRKVAGA